MQLPTRIPDNFGYELNILGLSLISNTSFHTDKLYSVLFRSSYFPIFFCFFNFSAGNASGILILLIGSIYMSSYITDSE